MNDLFSNYPSKIKVSTQRGDLWYARLHSLYAVHGPMPSQCSAEIVCVIEEGKLVVCRGDPTKLPAPCDLHAITPVYALGQSDVPAVPSGLILVRFSDHVQADTQRNTLLQNGFVIDRVLPHAPQAAWVKSAEGDFAAALRGISELEALPKVINVEPQMLMEAVRRGTDTTLRE
jgi:hypothetical protein